MSRVLGRWRRVIGVCVVVIFADVGFVVVGLSWVGGVGSSRVEVRSGGGFFSGEMWFGSGCGQIRTNVPALSPWLVWFSMLLYSWMLVFTDYTFAR